MKKINFYLFLFLFICLAGFAFLFTQKWVDPDFGWHLKTGQLIFQRGIPKIDWYSYTMPNFKWIDHEWMTDVFIYKMYSIFGKQLLLLFFLSLYFLSFFIAKKKDQPFGDIAFPIILACFGTVAFLGIRSQLLTVFFVAVVWLLLDKFLEDNSKLIYFLPVLFILWANLHAGFAAGLFIIALVIALEIFKKAVGENKFFNFLAGFNLKEQPYKKIFTIAVILFLCFIATLANPYGLRLYQEVFRTIGDSFIKIYISEWVPLFIGNIYVFPFIYIAIFLSLLCIFYKKISFNNLVISLVFLLLALSSRRYFMIFAVLSTSIFGEMIFFARQKINPATIKGLFKGSKMWLAAIYIFFLLCIFGYGFYDLHNQLFYGISYPENAVLFLKTLPLSENLFNFYNWGGYLIWNLPERKVFIDGRMPSWKQNSQYAFGDYVDIYYKNKPGFENILKKYNVKLVLIPENSKSSLYQKLMKLGWKNIYQDNVAVILEKK